MCYMQIEELIKGEKYCNIKCLWYWNPNFSFSRGLQPLNNDNDVLRFAQGVRGFKIIGVCVEQKVEDVIFEEVNGEDANVEGANEEVNNGGANAEETIEGANVESNADANVKANEESNEKEDEELSEEAMKKQMEK